MTHILSRLTLTTTHEIGIIIPIWWKETRCWEAEWPVVSPSMTVAEHVSSSGQLTPEMFFSTPILPCVAFCASLLQPGRPCRDYSRIACVWGGELDFLHYSPPFLLLARAFACIKLSVPTMHRWGTVYSQSAEIGVMSSPAMSVSLP